MESAYLNISMKRVLFISLIVCLSVSLVACSSENQKSKVEIVAEQLTGTWISNDSKNVFSKWTFIDGTYTLEIFVDGNKKKNPNYGTYRIGDESIYTIQHGDQAVTGEIPYTVDDGILHLHGANGDLTKEK